MENRQEKMAEFVALLEKHTPQDALCPTQINNLIIFRASQRQRGRPLVYEPSIVIGAQGKKNAYLEGKKYEYGAGRYMVSFMPMAVECEITEASPEKPLLGLCLFIDRNRLSQLLLKIDRLEETPIKPDVIDASGIFSAPLKDNLLDATIRLLKTLSSASEAAIVGEAIIDEIYFRILSDIQGGALVHLLQQRGQIQQISKAVEYLHQNMNQTVSVDDLADIVHMSSSGFYKKFKEVMHLAPLQYAKSIKLNKAQTYIMDGKSVTEAGYMVGYNSPAQFSREYKRHFGLVPSAT